MITNNIKTVLKQRKITQAELAEKIGMTRNGLSLSLKNDDFKTSVLAKIAKALDVQVSYFFEVEPELGSKKIIGNGNSVGSFNMSGNSNTNAELMACRKEVDYLKKEEGGV